MRRLQGSSTHFSTFFQDLKSILCKKDISIATKNQNFFFQNHHRFFLFKSQKDRFIHFSLNDEQFSSNLQPPSILYSNHHLIIINKTPGWHSVPIPNNVISQKCLLTKLKQDQLGGGSQKDFLLPVHRIDQPCSGILVYAKNSKAAKRVHTSWKKGQVQKEYLCVVKHDSNFFSGCGHKSDEWQDLYGVLHPIQKHQRSVRMTHLLNDYIVPNSSSSSASKNARICHLRYQILSAPLPHHSDFTLLRVVTNTGARHQVRAMLSQLLQTPVVGDLRYGTKFYKNESSFCNFDQRGEPLPDQSVALHARSLSMPHVKLGSMEFLKSELFTAPVPSTWKSYFGLTEELIQDFDL